MTKEKLLRKAHFWARILGVLPGVRAIFLSGSVAQGHAKDTSDIDFFIIARDGQIWTARFFVFAVLKIFGQMRTEKCHAGKICPNHFITDSHLEIQEKDTYSADLFSHLIPLYDPYLLNTKFVQENEQWIKEFVGTRHALSLRTVVSKQEQPLGNFARTIENFLRTLQIKKIKSNPDFRLPGAKIVLEDGELRFHPKPKNRR